MRGKQTLKSVLVGVAAAVLAVSAVSAQQSSSTNYKVNEAQFGSGGNPNLTSNGFSANASAGSNGVGTSNSANFSAEAGFLTPNEPYLEFVVNTPTVDLGTLSDSVTSRGTGSFYVRSYLNDDYVVRTMSQPPQNEHGYALKNMTAQATPTVGTEQFGINLVANTSPASFGTDPVNQPGASFADGEAVSGYNTANLFKYVPGDIVAHAPKTLGNRATGRTDYTVSYVANMAPLTPAGLYTMNHDLVVVATY